MNGMTERLIAIFPFLLLAALAALTFWLDQAVQPVPRGPEAASRHDPDYIVEHLTAVRTNAKGLAAYQLSAARMVHYPDDDTTFLTLPRLVSFRSVQAPVTITAGEALVSSNGENVYFKEDVKVTRAAYGDHSEMVMRTTYLHVIPDDSIAKTDRPVTITDATTVVNAVGLELNSETRVLKLLSRVRGTYDASTATKNDGAKRSPR
jgi:lipopolysaccharide export system protein LptC